MEDKFKETVHYDSDGRTFTVQRQYDVNPTLEQAKIIRDSGAGVTGENRLVGRIPMFMVDQWMKVFKMKFFVQQILPLLVDLRWLIVV